MNDDGNDKYDHWNENSIDELNSRIDTIKDWIQAGRLKREIISEPNEKDRNEKYEKCWGMIIGHLYF